MVRQRCLMLGAPLVATAALLLSSGASYAQHGGGHGGGHAGGSFHAAPSAGHATAWHGSGTAWHGGTAWNGNTWHGGWDGHHHNGYYYPWGFGLGLALGYGLGGYGGYGYGYPYSGYGYGYSPGYYGYDYGYPVAQSNYYYPDTSYPDAYYPPVGYQSYYAQPGAAAAVNTAAKIDVMVPAGARIWFNDVEMTKQTGATREYVTQPLTPGKNYTYDIKARWNTPSGPVEQTRTIQFQAGGQALVNFTI